MKVIMKDPTYKKLDHSTKRCVDLGIKKLQQRIDSYLNQSQQINQVFNDDTLIHDIICGFYVYKCRANNNQLRLLYTMNNNKLIIISHFIKKTDEANHNQAYIPHFKKVCETLTQKGNIYVNR